MTAVVYYSVLMCDDAGLWCKVTRISTFLSSSSQAQCRLGGESSAAVVFLQGETFSTSPAQKFQEVQTGVKDLVVLEHHLVKGIDGKVTVGVGIFERGHGGVKCVSLVAEGGILHGDDLESVLEREKESSLAISLSNRAGPTYMTITAAIQDTSAMSSALCPKVSKICL